MIPLADASQVLRCARLDPDARPVDRALRRQQRLRRGAARRRHPDHPRRGHRDPRVRQRRSMRDGYQRPAPHVHHPRALGSPHRPAVLRPAVRQGPPDHRASDDPGGRRAAGAIRSCSTASTSRSGSATCPRRSSRSPAACEHRIGSARITAIALNHPGGANGFRIDDDDGTSVCYLTDNELYPPAGQITTPAELARFAAGASLIIHDAQYLPGDMPAKRGWGHSLVDEVLALARDAEARRGRAPPPRSRPRRRRARRDRRGRGAVGPGPRAVARDHRGARGPRDGF